MPRNGSGTYSLPQPPFVAGTVISSAAVNSDLGDIASALTASLPRDGQAGMSGQFKTVDGSTIAPGLSFNNESDTGFYRAAAGQIGISINGIEVGFFDADGFNGLVKAGLPVGAILDYGGSTAPDLFLLAFGQAVSRTTFADLFAAYGTTYGSGDGVNTFNVVDGRDFAFVGKDDMGGTPAGRLTTAFFGTNPAVLGNPGGAQSTTLLTANLPPYTPTGAIAVDPHSHTIQTVGLSGAQVFYGSQNIPRGNVPNTANTQSTDPTTATAAFTGVAQGGVSTAFSNVQPSLVMNKIIYAGV